MENNGTRTRERGSNARPQCHDERSKANGRPLRLRADIKGEPPIRRIFKFAANQTRGAQAPVHGSRQGRAHRPAVPSCRISTGAEIQGIAPTALGGCPRRMAACRALPATSQGHTSLPADQTVDREEVKNRRRARPGSPCVRKSGLTICWAGSALGRRRGLARLHARSMWGRCRLCP